EMLIGETPFSGPSAQVVLARHAMEQVRDMRLVRSTVSASLERVVRRAMAKSPADRFATGKEFAAALAGSSARPSWGVPRLPQRMVSVSRRGLTIGLVTLVAVALALGFRWRLGSRASVPLNPDLAIVLPFRVVGSEDPGLTAIARQATEQLAPRLTGDGGPRAAYSGTVMAALRKARADSGDVTDAVARRVAGDVGAGLLLRGQLWKDGTHLILGATLLSATHDTVLARVERVTGSPDSLDPLLDRLTAELLARASGAREDEVRSLSLAPLPALRSYLAGRRAFAHGEFSLAARRYVDAVRFDSTFVQAALGMVATRTFVSDTALERGDTLAILSRGRLLPADQSYLDALRWQAPGDSSLKLWETAVRVAPDRMERWYGLGEVLFHQGPWLGLTEWRVRAAAAFRHALELDPDFVPALGHALDLAAAHGDTAAVRDLGARYIARDSVGELAEYYRWRIAVAVGDSGAMAKFRAQLDRQSIPSLERLVNVAQLDGVALEDAVAAAEVIKRNAGLGNETRWGYTKLHEIALNRGRPAEAAALIRQRDEAVRPAAMDHLNHIVEAIFWGADTTLASAIVRNGAVVADASPARESEVAPALYDVCGVSLWRAANGEMAKIPAAITRLRRAIRGAQDSSESTPGLCASVLELEVLAAKKDPALDGKLADFDAYIGSAPGGTSWITAASNLTIARLLEAKGDIRGALRAVRRRAYITDIREARVLVALSTFLREEGRLATLAGERDEAIGAYRHYLALRSDAEPSSAKEVAEVRGALKAVSGKGERR
ncbi:MAG: hypothetical protein ABJD11_18975, partial [Gemmatimonadota bacterium]